MSKIVFLDDGSIDKIFVYLATQFDEEENYINWLLNKNIQPIQIIKPDKFSDLSSVDNLSDASSDDLFYTFSSDLQVDTKESANLQQFTLIDLTNLSLANSKNLDLFLNFTKTISLGNVYFYTNDDKLKLNADFKKTLKSFGIDLVSIKKIDYDVALKMAIAYRNEKKIMVTEQIIDKLVQISYSYKEILDKLDFLSLLNEPKNAFKMLIPEENPALFMLGFDPNKPNYEKWLKLVTPDEQQLAFSLIITKLNKLNNAIEARKWKKRVIEMDIAIKSSSNMSADNLWKYFLWQFKNGV